MGNITSVRGKAKGKTKETVIEPVNVEKSSFKSKFGWGAYTWGKRIFHTLFFGMFVYLVILLCMMIIPTVMGYVVGALKYDLEETSQAILSLFSGMFFVAWVFVGTYKLIMAVGKLYVSNIRKTIPLKDKDTTESK